MSRRTPWFLAAGAAAILALVLDLAGQWSAAIEVLVVAVIFVVVGFRSRPKG